MNQNPIIALGDQLKQQKYENDIKRLIQEHLSMKFIEVTEPCEDGRSRKFINPQYIVMIEERQLGDSTKTLVKMCSGEEYRVLESREDLMNIINGTPVSSKTVIG